MKTALSTAPHNSFYPEVPRKGFQSSEYIPLDCPMELPRALETVALLIHSWVPNPSTPECGYLTSNLKKWKTLDSGRFCENIQLSFTHQTTELAYLSRHCQTNANVRDLHFKVQTCLMYWEAGLSNSQWNNVSEMSYTPLFSVITKFCA